MESYLTTETAATSAPSNASKESSKDAEKSSSLEQNAIQAHLMFLKVRLLQLRELHRQAIRGMTDLSISEFLNMQREMNSIQFELNDV